MIKRNQPLFYDDISKLVMVYNEDNKSYKKLGILLKVEYNNSPIIYDGNYCSVVKPLKYEDSYVQHCVLSNFVYYPNDDNQWVYVGTYDDQCKNIEWKTINLM